MNICKMLLSIIVISIVIPTFLFSQKIAADSLNNNTPDTQVTDLSSSLMPDPKDKIIVDEKTANPLTDAASKATESDIQGREVILLGEIIEASIIFVISILLIFAVRLLFNRFSKFINLNSKRYIKSIKFKKYNILNERQILEGVLFLLNFIKYALSLLILFLTIPLIFGIFPQTHKFAATFWSYFLSPAKAIFWGIVNYIPNLITIILILFAVKYLIKMLRFFSNEIENGRLVIKGFYPDWAKPTYFLFKSLIYIFTIALIYPYLPNSSSHFFQGISIFIGIIVSFGSTSAIGNLIAGIMITYMRPFKIGDRIKVGESVGMVVEKNAVVVKIKTDKKEFITFPNITILTSSITNFSQSNESENGLIIHTDITYNYAVSWRKIHELLIEAAKKTQFIEKTPEPFVLQKALNDFYCVYEINAYTKEIEKVVQVYSELHQNIQDVFAQAGLDLTAPHYEIYTKKNTKKTI